METVEQVEVSEKYLAEFGYGQVPVRYAFGWAGAENAWDWFERAHEALDVVDSLNCSLDELVELSHRYRELPPFDPTVSDQAAREVVGELMRAGLSLRQVARWLEVSDREIVMRAIGKYGGEKIEEILRADELLRSELYTQMRVVRETGLARRTVQRLDYLRRDVRPTSGHCVP